jgi:hypothetical protein
VDIVVAVNEEVVASAASASSPSSSLCVRGRGIDGGVAHGLWQPASINTLGRLRAAGGRGKGAIDKRIHSLRVGWRNTVWCKPMWVKNVLNVTF